MMDGEVYPDFVLLWLLCHQSRVEADRPEECSPREVVPRRGPERHPRPRRSPRRGGEGDLRPRLRLPLPPRQRRTTRAGSAPENSTPRTTTASSSASSTASSSSSSPRTGASCSTRDADDAAKDRYTRFYSTRKLRARGREARRRPPLRPLPGALARHGQARRRARLP